MTTIYRVTVDIRAPVKDTELRRRVETAVTNLFPNAEPVVEKDELTATVHDLEHFSTCLHRQEILDTARSEFFDGQGGNRFHFSLKKAAAFEGRVNFAVGEPDELGEIDVTVQVDEPTVDAYIDRVAPETEDGKPVE